MTWGSGEAYRIGPKAEGSAYPVVIASLLPRRGDSFPVFAPAATRRKTDSFGRVKRTFWP